LFKKRKLKTDTSVSIAMLVPSPTEEVKALIGDKNADEVSDLSETESNNDNGNDGDNEQDTNINGHKLTLSAYYNRNELGPDSLISNQSLTSLEPLVSEAKNNLIFMNNRPINQYEPRNLTMSSESSSLTTNSGDNKYNEENNNIIETFDVPSDSFVTETDDVTNDGNDQVNNNVTSIEVNKNGKNSVVTTAELILAPPEAFQPVPAARKAILVEDEVVENASARKIVEKLGEYLPQLHLKLFC
jgi:hypothetical protein